MLFVRYTIVINFFLLFFVIYSLNAFSFLSFEDSHLSKFFSAYEGYISENEKNTLKKKKKFLKKLITY